jgi:hypothetical protein
MTNPLACHNIDFITMKSFMKIPGAQCSKTF